MTYTYPKSTPITFRVVAALVLLGAIAFAFDSYEAPRSRIIVAAAFSIAGFGLLKAAAYYRAFRVTLGTDLVEYEARSKTTFRLVDVAAITVDAIRGGKAMTVALKSGERHFVPGDLANFSALVDELAANCTATVTRMV